MSRGDSEPGGEPNAELAPGDSPADAPGDAPGDALGEAPEVVLPRRSDRHRHAAPRPARRGPTRRVVIGLGALAALGGALTWRASSSRPTPNPTRTIAVTAASWRTPGGGPSYIAHRGAGDLVPEHTLESYRQALAWGARCLEISVVRTEDGVLLCQHDTTYERTTTLTGAVAEQPSSVVRDARIDLGHLGPRWSGANSPRISLLQDVLAEVGGRAVLAIEAKTSKALDPMLAMVREHGLESTILLKVNAAGGAMHQAVQSGLPLFAYLGNSEDATAAAITALGPRLNGDRDLMVLPARGDDGAIFPADLVRLAVATGVPVGVYPVHRRSEVAAFTALGVAAFVTPDLSYVAETVAPAATDGWETGQLSPGQLVLNPYSAAQGLRWRGDGVVTLDWAEHTHFLLLGNLGRLGRGGAGYRLEVEVRFDDLPDDRQEHVSVAFGHADDRYYAHRSGTSDGTHAMLRANGEMAVFEHHAGTPESTLLGRRAATPALAAGAWTRLSLEVTADRVSWSRDGRPGVVVPTPRWHEGYLHIGRSDTGAALSVRRVRVTAL